ncbi:ctf18 [Candida margitis]|uniref:ctf18 n=1 Tax=Candida margitis TaxID=1775924 RepID=UPI00222681A2|nr:ctf18 [Candida margitis]KAI5968798.1 ctf18 [Candida margitis]
MTREGVQESINLTSSLLFAPAGPLLEKEVGLASDSAAGVTNPTIASDQEQTSEMESHPIEQSQLGSKGVKLFSGQMINLKRRGREEPQESQVNIHKQSQLYLDMDSLFARVELKNKIRENSLKMDSKEEPNTSNYMPLWTEKYKPQNFLQLAPAGNEKQYRSIMRWLQKWSTLVFDDRVKEHIDGTDSLGRPSRKILLIHGPPGVGKTVATHILARQMGYNIQELNAMNSMDTLPQGSVNSSAGSNAYSNASNALKLKIQNTLTSNAVSKNGKPFCLLIDELDSLANTNDVVKILQDIVTSDQRAYMKQQKYVNGQSDNDQKRKKKNDRILNRPIICIANDIYSRQQGKFGPNPLERLRAISEVVTFRKPAIAQRATGAKVSGSAMKSVKDFLMKINERENLGLDYRDIGEICEVCDGDLRACLNQMQFSGKRLASGTSVKKVSAIDKHISWFTMVEDMFKRDPQLKKEDNFSVLLQKYMDGNGKSITGSNDLFDKFINGVFNKYLDIIHLQDDTLIRPSEFSDWLHYHDSFNTNFNDANQYNALIALKSWTLFSDLKTYRDINPLIPNAKNLSFETFEKLKENRHVVKTVVSNIPAATQLGVGSTNADSVACCFLPCLTKILSPSLSSKSKGNLTPTEIAKLEKVTSLIESFKLGLETRRDFESGQMELYLAPDWDALTIFDTFLAARSSAIEVKQLQLRRQALFPMVNAELENLSASRRSQKQKRKLDGVDNPEFTKKPKTGDHEKQTFKSQYDNVKQASKPDDEIVKQVPRIWVNFNEGYSNAVRKEVSWNDIWLP